MASLYKLDLTLQRRYFVTNFRKHTDVPEWLKTNGEPAFIYEVWKQKAIHSRWCWQLKKGKWGRMTTPKSKTDDT
jgi:hypothetical protein